MFMVAGFSIVGGLGTSMENLSSSLESERSIVMLPSGSGDPQFFTQSALGDLSSDAAFGIYFEAEIVFGPDAPTGLVVAAFCLVDPHSVTGETISTTGDQLLLGTDYPYRGYVTLGGLDAFAVGGFSSALFSPAWVLVSPEIAEEITRTSGSYNFAIVRGVSDADREALSAAGFVVQPMSGIVTFLEDGVAELEADAFWMLVPSCFAIVVLAYGFMGSEISDRRHEIGILKTIGAGRRRVLSYLLLDALIISTWGGLLGVALGIVVSYAVSTAASVMFTSVFLMKASEPLLMAALAVTVASGVVGALVPAARMTVSPPVEDLKEVAP
jgi:hypothetical protein